MRPQYSELAMWDVFTEDRACLINGDAPQLKLFSDRPSNTSHATPLSILCSLPTQIPFGGAYHLGMPWEVQ